MIRVNLLPLRSSKRQESVRNEVVFAGLVGAALVGMLLVLHVLVLARVSSARSDNAALKDEIARKQAIVAEVDEAEKIKGDLQRKLGVIAQLKTNKGGPVHMLNELAQATPEKLQLTSLDQSGETVKLVGVAVSNEVISEFLSRLEQSAYFTDVYLNEIDQVDKKGVKIKSFSLTARLVVSGVVPDAEPAPEKAKAKAKAPQKAKAKVAADDEADQ